MELEEVKTSLLSLNYLLSLSPYPPPSPVLKCATPSKSSTPSQPTPISPAFTNLPQQLRKIRNSMVKEEEKEKIREDFDVFLFLFEFILRASGAPSSLLSFSSPSSFPSSPSSPSSLPPPSTLKEIIVMGLQAIANFITASPTSQSFLFSSPFFPLFPSLFLSLALGEKVDQEKEGKKENTEEKEEEEKEEKEEKEKTEEKKIQEEKIKGWVVVNDEMVSILIMILLNSTTHNSTLFTTLVEEKQVLIKILRVLSHSRFREQERSIEFATYLFENLISSPSLLPPFYLSLFSYPIDENTTLRKLTEIHTNFLRLIEAIISLKTNEIKEETVEEVILPSSSLLFLVKELELINSTLHTQMKIQASPSSSSSSSPPPTSPSSSSSSSSSPSPTLSPPPPDLLPNVAGMSALFSIFGDITSVISFEIRNELIERHLLEVAVFVLDLVVKLEPPVNVTKDKPKKESAFFGIKAAVTRIIGNLAYKNTVAQDMVRELGGLQLVMSQCGLDDNNPYGREWGVLALRNLTEGNQKNQDYIKEMNPVKVAENPELEKMGLKAELHDGKVTVKSAGEL